MSEIIVRYKVKPELVDENITLIEAVFAELSGAQVSGIGYAAYHGDDNWFTHVASIDEGIENPITQLESFTRFQANLADRCDEPPSPTPSRIIGFHNG